MLKKRVNRLVIVLLVLLMLFNLCGCGIFDIFLKGMSPTTNNVPEDALTILEQSMAYLTEKYVDELSDEELMAAAVAGADAIMSYYDDYGRMLTPEEYYALIYPQEESISRPIFGFSYSQIPYLGLYVSSITADSGASIAGLKVGDIVVDIRKAEGIIPLPVGRFTFMVEGETDARTLDVKTTHTSYIQQVLANEVKAYFYILRGATQVDGYFVGGEMLPNPVYLIKKPIPVPEEGKMHFVEYYASASVSNVSSDTATQRRLDKLDDTTVGYLHIKLFSDVYDNDNNLIASTSGEVKTALDTLKASGKTKIILDLQGNPGGDVVQICKTCVYFVHNNGNKIRIAVIEGRDGLSNEYSEDSKYSEFFSSTAGTNIIVLTDKGSASASEMLTGAILAYNTGIQVGTTTFGKGIAQTFTPVTSAREITLADGTTVKSYYAVYYTMGKYYNITPDGRKIGIHGVGYTPLAENTISEYSSQIDRALELLLDE